MSKEAKLLADAQDQAASVQTWADLSNFLFDPEEGLIAKAYPTRAERETFIKTPEYKAVRKLIADARKKFGLIEGATPIQNRGACLLHL